MSTDRWAMEAMRLADSLAAETSDLDSALSENTIRSCRRSVAVVRAALEAHLRTRQGGPADPLLRAMIDDGIVSTAPQPTAPPDVAATLRRICTLADAGARAFDSGELRPALKEIHALARAHLPGDAR